VLDGIYSIGVDGAGVTRLSHSPLPRHAGRRASAAAATAKPTTPLDGTRFVFMCKQCEAGPDPSRDEAAALYVANTDGTGLHQITAYGQADSHPGGSMRWSPDGTKILLASQDHHLHLIYPTAAP
jgi:Tol biopolymer transport system component